MSTAPSPAKWAFSWKWIHRQESGHKTPMAPIPTRLRSHSVIPLQEKRSTRQPPISRAVRAEASPALPTSLRLTPLAYLHPVRLPELTRPHQILIL